MWTVKPPQNPVRDYPVLHHEHEWEGTELNTRVSSREKHESREEVGEGRRRQKGSSEPLF